MKTAWSLGELQAALRVPGWRIAYLVTSGAVAAPEMVAGRRIFRAEHIRAICKRLDVPVPLECREPDGAVILKQEGTGHER